MQPYSNVAAVSRAHCFSGICIEPTRTNAGNTIQENHLALLGGFFDYEFLFDCLCQGLHFNKTRIIICLALN
ncbi:hypothetical protein MRX96_050467 [Rhipicephalus microplus]